MFHRIFDDGLQNESRHAGRQEFPGNLDLHLQAFREPDLLDVQILFQKFQFLSQRHLLAIGIL